MNTGPTQMQNVQQASQTFVGEMHGVVRPDPRIALNGQHETLMRYLRVKVEAHDWHAVADAAMDLREVEAKLSMLESR